MSIGKVHVVLALTLVAASLILPQKYGQSVKLLVAARNTSALSHPESTSCSRNAS